MPGTQSRALRACRLVFAVVCAVALPFLLATGLYAMVAQRPVPGIQVVSPIVWGMFVVGALIHGLSRLPRLGGQQPIVELSVGGGRLLKGLLFVFLLMIGFGFLGPGGVPATPRPDCPYPLTHRGGAQTCVSEAEYHAVGAGGQLVGVGIAGTALTAFAAPVLSPVVALVATRFRRRGKPSADTEPTDDGPRTGAAGTGDVFDKGFGQLD